MVARAAVRRAAKLTPSKSANGTKAQTSGLNRAAALSKKPIISSKPVVPPQRKSAPGPSLQQRALQALQLPWRPSVPTSLPKSSNEDVAQQKQDAAPVQARHPLPQSPAESPAALTFRNRRLLRGRRDFRRESVITPALRGRLEDLRFILGLEIGISSRKPHDAVFVSLDTEFERQGLIDQVVEVGITTLSTRDIRGVEPGQHVRNWVQRMKHYHFVVGDTRFRSRRVGGSLFAESEMLSSKSTKEAVLRVLRQASLGPQYPPDDSRSREKSSPKPLPLLLVGQSISNDLEGLRRSHNLNLLDPTSLTYSTTPISPYISNLTPKITTIFDTFTLADNLLIRPAALGLLARYLGVDPRFWRQDRYLSEGVKGVHNASNDAAYAMMVLMVLGVKGPELEAKARVEEGRREAMGKEVNRVGEVWRRGSDVKEEAKGWLGRLARWFGLNR